MSRSYYLDAAGSDLNDGLSPQSPLKTFTKINLTTFHPGDQVLLKGGQTFKGRLMIKLTGPGFEENPIIVGSTGTERAVIESPGPAIFLESAGVCVRDLVLKGTANRPLPNHHGIAAMAKGLVPHPTVLENLEISNVDISGFGASGIKIYCSGRATHGFRRIRLSKVSCHDNYGRGIDIVGRADGAHPHSDVEIADCEASRNAAGSGIVVAGVNGGRVVRCRAFENAGDGGGVAIWAWDSKQVQIMDCIAAHTRSKGADGGGFDLDGGCVECGISGCLSYNNDGPGYMHCDYPQSPPTHANEIASNISINDGRKPAGDNVGIGFVTWGSGLDSCVLKDNIVVITEPPPAPKPKPAFFVSYVKGGEKEGDVLHVKSSRFEDNKAVVLYAGYALVDTDEPAPTTDVQFEGNKYFVAERATPLFMAGDKVHTDLTGWKKATSLKSSDRVLAANEDFRGTDYQITDCDRIADLRGVFAHMPV